jgi:hypothetical protein
VPTLIFPPLLHCLTDEARLSIDGLRRCSNFGTPERAGAECNVSAIPLTLIQGDDLEAIRRKRSLRLESRSDTGLEPRIELGRVGQHHRHGLGWTG